MRRRLKKAPPVDPANYTPGSPISRAEFVRMIADRMRQPDDDDQIVRNRVSHRISDAIKQGKLPTPTSGEFLFRDVVYWAQSAFPGMLNDPPLIGLTMNIQATLPMLEASLTGEVLPTDLAGCQQMLLEYITKATALEAELRAVRAENERLRPDAERWQKFMASRRKRGKA